MATSFTDALVGALQRFFDALLGFLPNLLAAFVILVLGTVAGWIVRLLVRRALQLARFDRFCEQAGIGRALSRADIAISPSALGGRLAFWFVVLSFAMAALSALHLAATSQLVEQFFLYLPQIFSAAAILVVGFLTGNFLSRATLLAAVNAGAPSPRAFALVVKLLISVLAFAMALVQLRIATAIVLAAFVITFGAVMLALAIAFGIGGTEVARRVLERQVGDAQSPPSEPDEISHL